MLCRGFIIPQEIRDGEAVTRFLESVAQMERILNDSGLLRIDRLTEAEIVGTDSDAGLLARYFALTDERQPTVNEDIRLDPGMMRIGDKLLSMHTLSDLDLLPQSVTTDFRYERLSTDRSECRLSFAAPAGLLLGCSHIYNQYLFLDNHDETLKRLEARARNMNSLANYSRGNALNKEWIDLYLNEAHSQGLRSVRCHCNVVVWAESEAELKRLRNDVGSQLATMGCTPHHNTVDMPVLFWAAIPGNEADFPAEESFLTFLEQGVCLFNGETNYRSSLSPFGIKMADRLTGVPLHLDISDLPMKRGITTNRNKFILGPSGSGKSFFTNHMVRQYYEQGAHILLVDTGNSYEGLCSLIHRTTRGRDGIYFTYTEQEPIAFNPFYVEDGVYDIEKRESIKTLLLTLWKRESEEPTRAEEVALSNAVNLYLSKLKTDDSIQPSFNTFYEFLASDYRRLLEQKHVREKDFDLANLLNVLEPYYRGGEYDYLLNSDRQLDLLSKRFIVFELDNISSNKTLLPVVTIIIMEVFIDRRVLEGPHLGQHVDLHPLPLQDGAQVFRRGGRRYAGGRRHHLLADRQGVDHQQCRLQDSPRPAQVHEQVRPDPDVARSFGEGAGADPLDQPGERSPPHLQGGLDRTRWRAVGGLRYGGLDRGVPLLHHRGAGEDGGDGPGREARRRHPGSHPRTGPRAGRPKSH